MQNIPGVAVETASELITAVKASTTATLELSTQDESAFTKLFNEHKDVVESELSLAPVSHEEEMLETATEMMEEEHEDVVNVSGVEAPVKQEEPASSDDALDTKMTRDDLDKVKDDLEEYGFSEEEIAAMEEQIDSEDGMTWREFSEKIAEKIEEEHSVELTSDQQTALVSFFSKLGFSNEESNNLLTKLQNGKTDEVMQEIQAKLDELDDSQEISFDKSEIEAFSSALGFSQEFTDKLQQMLGSNTLPKEVKKAFTLINQEMADKGAREQELVRAVGEAFAEAMGDTLKESSAARQITEAIDQKARAAEENIEVEDPTEDLTEAVKARKDSLPDNAVRAQDAKNSAQKVEIKTDDSSSDELVDGTDEDSEADADSGSDWDNLFNNMQNRDSGQNQTAKAEASSLAAAAAKTAQTTTDTTKTKAWEKVSAPKIIKQVDNAIIRTLSNGSKQLTVQLTPQDLGKLSIVLSTTQNKEVTATIRTENSDTAKVINENIHQIKQSLESQGLKVEKLDVQTGLTNNQSYNNWYGQGEHNMAREREVMVAMRNHMRSMRENFGTEGIDDVQQLSDQVSTSAQGLHLIA